MRKVMKILLCLAFVTLFTATVSAEPAAPTGENVTVVGGGHARVYNEAKGETESANYIIQLTGEPVATYTGGIAGLEATSPLATGARKLDSQSPASLAYEQYLADKQDQFVADMNNLLGRNVDIVFTYRHAYNGVAAFLSPAEAARVAEMDGVILLYREGFEEILTDAGPAFIGAETIWNATGGNKGEGVIVGIIDTGINSDHPSFADIGGDGYDHTNPFGSGNYVGYCVANPSFCNDKLIGAWAFHPSSTNPEDADGHGSHTASTVAGNYQEDAILYAPTISYTFSSLSGVAPHANIIAYQVCVPSCPTASTTAAVNQAVIDGVDVTNYSISGGTNPYVETTAVAFLNAVAAGVFPSNSAGNAGPGAGTVGHQGPWIMTVAASTHDRAVLNSVVDLSNSTGTHPDILGESAAAGYGPATLVYAGDPPYNNPLCNPFTPGTFSGEIVVCDRGIIGRVEKGQNVLNAGGGGMILANDINSAASLNADTHVLPATHISYADGVDLKAWMAAGTGDMGTITGGTVDYDAAYGDNMASFSSRGPAGGAVPGLANLIKPDVTAPGLNILAAFNNGFSTPPEFNIISGTSMSSPHAAGAAALIRAMHPDWTPAQVKSALMMTGITAVDKEDDTTPGDPFDFGAGRVNLTTAGDVAFVLDIDPADYVAANPGIGGDPKLLNLPSLANSSCFAVCSWTRTISGTYPVTTTWMAVTTAPAGMSVTVTPATFELPPYGTQTLTIEADVSGLTEGAWAFADVRFVEQTITAIVPTSVTLSGPSTTAVDTAVSFTADVLPLDTTLPLTYTWSATDQTGSTVVVSSLSDTITYTWTTTGTKTITVTAENAAGLVMDTHQIIVSEAPPPTIYLPVIFKSGTTAQASQHMNAPVGGGVGIAPDVHFPIAVIPTEASCPPLGKIEIAATSDAGSHDVACTPDIDVTNLTADISGLVLATEEVDSLNQDPTNGDPYDNLNDVAYITTTVSAGDILLVAEVVEATAPDVDLYVGTGDTPSAATEVCASTSPIELESCKVEEPTPGVWWILVQNWQASGSPPDMIRWVHAVLSPSDAGNMTVTGPDVSAGQTLTLTVSWNDTMNIGEFWYGAFTLDTDNGNLGGPYFVNLDRVDPNQNPIIDVDPDSLTSSQAPDTVVTEVLTINNLGGSDLDWTIFEDPDAMSRASTGFWSDNFDSYPTGQDLHGIGGWKGWNNDPGASALTTAAQARSAPNSVDIVGTADLVHEYAGATSGQWTYTAWQYIPSSMTGLSYFILLNTYVDNGTNNWSVQVNFNAATDVVTNDGASGGTLPLIEDQWVEIRLEIDLDADTQEFYYNNQLLYSGTWTGEVSGGGVLNIGAVDLFANAASSVYYDDMSLTAVSQACDAPGDITWATVSPTSGTTAPSSGTDVDVTFDSTGLSMGTYEGTLCVTSNDPVTPLVEVPLMLDVTAAPPIIDVSPSSLTSTQSTNTVVTETLTIANLGSSDLDWTIDEAAPVVRYTTGAAAPAVEDVTGALGGPIVTSELSDYQYPTGGVLYDNGPLVNCAGCGVGGADESVLQTVSLGMNTLGFGHQFTAGNRMADDFTITDAEGWTIDTIDFFAYQSFAGPPSTITGVYFQIWDGPPNDPGSSVIFGDTTTNRMASTTWANIYRVTETTTGTNTDRPIMASTATAGVWLAPGTYWLDWMSDGSAASGPWAPPVTINGQAITGNGMQYIGSTSTWGPANDTGTGTPQQGLPFIVMGSVGGGSACDSPSDIPWLSVSPSSGTTAGGASTDVDITFDSTGLTTGVYTGTLCINSNDPVTPLVEVPVELNVGP